MSKIYSYRGTIEPFNKNKLKFRVKGLVYARNINEASSALMTYYSKEKYTVSRLDLVDIIDGPVCEEERSET